MRIALLILAIIILGGINLWEQPKPVKPTEIHIDYLLNDPVPKDPKIVTKCSPIDPCVSEEYFRW